MDDSPYKLDKIGKYAALTRKNAAFIGAIVKLDSNYAKDLIVKEPDKKFDLNKAFKRNNNKSNPNQPKKTYYCGSTKYWFKKMLEPNSDFRTCVLGAVLAIDRTNTTHLESAVNGRKKMRDVVCKHCKNVNGLIKMLEEPFEASNKDHLISLLTKGIPDKNGGERCNLSFATKFCANGALFLNVKNEYSKYDNIVSDVLPKYVELYLNEHRNKTEYKVKERGKYQHYLDIYEKYFNDIGRIISKVKGQGINRDKFDRIVWYCNKGAN